MHIEDGPMAGYLTMVKQLSRTDDNYRKQVDELIQIDCRITKQHIATQLGVWKNRVSLIIDELE